MGERFQSALTLDPRDVSRKDTLIQRVKNQQNSIKVLQERIAEASAKHTLLSDKIKQRSSDSAELLHTLEYRCLQAENKLKTLLGPHLRASSDSNAATTNAQTSKPPSLTSVNQSLLTEPSEISTLSSGGNANSDNVAQYLSRAPINPVTELILARFLRSIRAAERQVAANRAEQQRSKFTEDSTNGKRMMSRLRVLECENAELARQKESGRPAKVATLMTMRRRIIENLRNESNRIEKLVEEAEAEMEVFSSTLEMLQQQLALAQATVEVLAVALTATPASERVRDLLRSHNWPIPKTCTS